MVNDELNPNDLVPIKVKRKTKKLLDAQKAHSSMSYDAVIFAYASGSNINWNRVPEEENKEGENNGGT